MQERKKICLCVCAMLLLLPREKTTFIVPMLEMCIAIVLKICTVLKTNLLSYASALLLTQNLFVLLCPGLRCYCYSFTRGLWALGMTAQQRCLASSATIVWRVFRFDGFYNVTDAWFEQVKMRVQPCVRTPILAKFRAVPQCN